MKKKLPPGVYKIYDLPRDGKLLRLDLTRKDGEEITVLGEDWYGLSVLAKKLINTSALKKHHRIIS